MVSKESAFQKISQSVERFSEQIGSYKHSDYNETLTMLELNKDLQKSKPGEEQERLKQRITYTDKKIDALVYELYGLTEEEIKVVEEV